MNKKSLVLQDFLFFITTFLIFIISISLVLTYSRKESDDNLTHYSEIVLALYDEGNNNQNPDWLMPFLPGCDLSFASRQIQEFQSISVRPRIRSGQDERPAVAGLHMDRHLPASGCGQNLPGNPPRPPHRGRCHAGAGQEILPRPGH